MVHMHSKQVPFFSGGNQKGLSCGCISVKMADTSGIGRHHFQVKTDVRESGIKEVLDKMYNEEFTEVSFTGSKKKKKEECCNRI